MISLLSNYALYQRAILLGEILSKAERNRPLDTSTPIGKLSYVRGKLHSIENHKRVKETKYKMTTTAKF
jgi:hypothetical protein